MKLGALERAEVALDLLELLVGAHDVGRVEPLGGDGGAQDVDAVQRGLLGDLGALARVVEAAIGDLEREVLFDAVALDHLPDGETDRAGVGQRAALDALGDRLELGLGGVKQRVALARAL